MGLSSFPHQHFDTHASPVPFLTMSKGAGVSNDTSRTLDHEEHAAQTADSIDLYSAFTKSQKRWIVFLVAFAASFSPLSSFIYYPALHNMSQSLHISLELLNLTITSYMIVSGVVPAIMGNAADMLGRRPIYMLVFSIYFVANIGLALQRSFIALLLLRMLQSAGSSGTRQLLRQIIREADRYRDYISCLWGDC